MRGVKVMKLMFLYLMLAKNNNSADSPLLWDFFILNNLKYLLTDFVTDGSEWYNPNCGIGLESFFMKIKF